MAFEVLDACRAAEPPVLPEDAQEELESVFDDWNEEIISVTLERFFLVGIGELIVRFRYGPPDLV